MKVNKQLIRILFLEDTASNIQLVENILLDTFSEYEIKLAKTEKEFLKFVIRFDPDVIISAFQLQKYSALDAVELLKTENQRIPFILITDKLTEESAKEVISTGIEDCVYTSNLTHLSVTILKAYDKKKISLLKSKAESELKKEQDRLQTIFRNTPEAIINIGFEGKILEINPAGLEMLQVDSMQKLKHKDIFQFIHPKDLKRFRKFHNSVGIGNKKTEGFRIVGSKKNEYWVETNAVPLLDEEKHIVSILTIHRDKTSQQLANREIAYQSMLLENVSDAIISVDAGLKIRSWNKGSENIYGWKAEEVNGKYFSNILSEEISHGESNESGSTIFTDPQWNGELMYHHKNGNVLTVLVSSSVLKDQLNTITGFVSVHRDITARKKTEVELQESQARLKTGQEIANMGYWDRDLITKQGVWSKQMFRIHERDETIGAPPSEVLLQDIHEYDRTAVLEFQKMLMKTGEKHTHTFRLKLENGKIKYILAIGQALFDSSGKPYRLMGIEMDITDQKLAEEKARANEKKFQDLFECSPDAIYVEDEKGFILDANKTACDFQGYNKEELIGKNIIDLIPEPYKARVFSGHEKLFSSEETIRESYIFNRSGHARPVEIKTNKMYFEGKPALLLHVRDITKRINAEKARRETEIKFDTLCAKAPVAIYQVDNNGKFVLANNKFLEIFEITVEQMKNEEWQNRIHPDDLSTFLKISTETLEKPKNLELHYRLLINGITKYLFGISNPLYNDEGIMIGRIGTIVDLTEDKLSKEQVMLTQTMFRNIFEHSPEPIFIEDLHGNILNANRKACHLQGLEHDELVGKNILELTPPDFHDEMLENFNKFCNGSLNLVKTTSWNKDGEKFPIEIRANLINYFDQVALILHVLPLAS